MSALSVPPGGWGSLSVNILYQTEIEPLAFRKDLCAADLGVCSGQAESEELRSVTLV